MAGKERAIFSIRALSSIVKNVSTRRSLESTVYLKSFSHTRATDRTRKGSSHFLIAISAGLFGTYAAVKTWTHLNQNADFECRTINVLKAASEEKDDSKITPKMTRREQRFNNFASCKYKGQVLMTPHDFLESLTENQPKYTRMGKIELTDEDIIRIKKGTPSIDKGSQMFFRKLDKGGIITYSEYLFLVTILTKSKTGLGIAFKMIDVDGNHHMHKNEFLAIQKMINKSATSSAKWSHKRLENTTLLLHLFGKEGQREISFEQCFKFMDDLQSEVLELEFHEFAKGMMIISEQDFARILLRNTELTQREYKQYLTRLQQRITEPKGINLDQFISFNRFLNNIDDFMVAMRMENMMHEPIAPDVFSRAVHVSTGEDIDPYVIKVVFNLFDNDGDGKLSDVEFIGIMKDRLKRGFGKFPNPHGWAGFKYCMRKEVLQSSDTMQ